MAREGSRAGPRDETAGTVLGVTPSGLLLLRAPGRSVVPEGTAVVEARGTRGRIARVFGPVARPYLTVRPVRTPRPEQARALLGSSFYAVREGPRGRR